VVYEVGHCLRVRAVGATRGFFANEGVFSAKWGSGPGGSDVAKFWGE